MLVLRFWGRKDLMCLRKHRGNQTIHHFPHIHLLDSNNSIQVTDIIHIPSSQNNLEHRLYPSSSSRMDLAEWDLPLLFPLLYHHHHHNNNSHNRHIGSRIIHRGIADTGMVNEFFHYNENIDSINNDYCTFTGGEISI